MIIFKKPDWERARGPKGPEHLTALILCPVCKQWGSLSRHDIAEDGTVKPSVVCSHPGCTFHEYIKLDGWLDNTVRLHIKIAGTDSTMQEDVEKTAKVELLVRLIKDLGNFVPTGHYELSIKDDQGASHWLDQNKTFEELQIKSGTELTFSDLGGAV
jgi:hypothetical protein